MVKIAGLLAVLLGYTLGKALAPQLYADTPQVWPFIEVFGASLVFGIFWLLTRGNE